MGQAGPKTLYLPSNEAMDVFDAAEKYKGDQRDLIILAGRDYGSGSSRDWAAKGPFLQGVKAVIAESYERIHRSNLVGMGIVPLQFSEGENADILGLTGKEAFTIELPDEVKPQQVVDVRTDSGKSFKAVVRFDTELELTYYKNGGILNYMIRKMIGAV